MTQLCFTFCASRDGASHVADTLSELQQAVLAVSSTEARTANELAMAAAINRGVTETYRKRVHELHRAGLLRVAGVRSCRYSGRECRTYTKKLNVNHYDKK